MTKKFETSILDIFRPNSRFFLIFSYATYILSLGKNYNFFGKCENMVKMLEKQIKQKYYGCIEKPLKVIFL